MRPAFLLKESFDNLGDITKWNLSKVSEYVYDRDELKNIDVKKVGGTVGKIVEILPKQLFGLLKKSGRTQIDAKALEDDEDPEIVKSRDVTVDELRGGIAESFNERCAARLFEIIKQADGYLPKFSLVRSSFDYENPEKRSYNKFKKDAEKVYVLSELIGNDPSRINNADDSHNVRLFDQRRPSHPHLLRDLTDDVCENAVIMFLLSNYDVKIDNFVHPSEDSKYMIPVDFGQARYNEKFSADIFDGIDLIRRARAGTTKVLTDLFSNSAMRDMMVKDDGYIGTQSFYYRNLKPEHFLKVIEKIKSDPEIENKLRQAAYEFTFGEPEEKERYADVITARIRNLVKLEPILRAIDPTSFPEKNLRDIVAASEEFDSDLKNTNHSKGKEFYRLIFDVFEKIEGDVSAIIAKLDEYANANDEKKEEMGKEIQEMVNRFNSYTGEKMNEVQSSFSELETYYEDSEYLKSEAERKGSWISYKKDISAKLERLFAVLLSPLEGDSPVVDEEDFYEDEDQSQSQEWEYEEDEISCDGSEELDEESSEELDEESSEESEEYVSHTSGSGLLPPLTLCRAASDDGIANWDLANSNGYKRSLENLMTQVPKWHEQIKKHTKLLMTHLTSYDELKKVQEDYREESLEKIRSDKESLQKLMQEERLRRENEEAERKAAKKAGSKPSSKVAGRKKSGKVSSTDKEAQI